MKILESILLFSDAHSNSTNVCYRDAVSTERAVELAANTKGICYIRTSRPNTDILYGNEEPFKVFIFVLCTLIWLNKSWSSYTLSLAICLFDEFRINVMVMQ